MTTASELIGVWKRYGDKEVLSGFDLRIEAGEMVAITGTSGSGKSTVLNLIGLLDKADEGEVKLLGVSAPKPRTRASNRLLRHHLGYLFQNCALIDGASVQENLEIALTYSRRSESKAVLIADALRRVGMAGAENRKVFSLSGGEQQRVAIARLMLKPCDIVLADEPTGSLDAANRDVVLKLLLELHHVGKTIIVATHDEVVAQACSRVITMGRA